MNAGRWWWGEGSGAPSRSRTHWPTGRAGELRMVTASPTRCGNSVRFGTTRVFRAGAENGTRGRVRSPGSTRALACRGMRPRIPLRAGRGGMEISDAFVPRGFSARARKTAPGGGCAPRSEVGASLRRLLQGADQVWLELRLLGRGQGMDIPPSFQRVSHPLESQAETSERACRDEKDTGQDEEQYRSESIATTEWQHGEAA